MRIFHSQSFDHSLQLHVGLVVENITTVRWLQAGALDTISKSTLLSLAVEALHAVLDLINAFLFAVKSLKTNQVESVTNQIALDRHIQRRISGK